MARSAEEKELVAIETTMAQTFDLRNTIVDIVYSDKDKYAASPMSLALNEHRISFDSPYILRF